MGHTISVQYEKHALPKGIGRWSMILILVGLIGTMMAFFMADDHGQRGAFASNIAFMFTISIGMGSLFFVALEHIIGAIWSVPFRRLAELLSNAIYIAPLFAIPILYNVYMEMGGHGLFNMFEWTHDEVVQNDVFLSQKAPYLNEGFFIARTVVIWLIMVVFRSLLVGNSYKQDRTGGQKINKASARLSGLFMVIFAISITVLAMDYMMSLEPHWFSTIFGVYYFAGTFNATIAILTLIAVGLNERGLLINGINKDHYYSLGVLMFAFTAFWMYMAFSQFMLIWYANIPEETFWFMPRMKGSFAFVSIGLIFIKFVIPFGLTIQRPAKMDPSRLRFVAVWILCAHLYDLYWLIYPTYAKMVAHHGGDHGAHGVTESSVFFGWQELSLITLAVGLILFVFNMAGKNRDLVAWNDPKINRGLNFHL